jgi:membrane protein implicated in regulation of membrane protease activity
MIEWLNTHILYWHWIFVGFLLIAIELFTPVFVALWLGVAAIIVGLVLLLLSIGLHAQLSLWIVLSAILLLLWHRFISPKMIDKTTAGLSREALIGQTGMVLSYNSSHGRGRLRFSAPIVGSDEWEFIYHGSIKHGDKVQVTDLSGNSLIVKAHS